MRRFFYVLAVCLVCSGIAQANDLWSTAVAERPSDGWKIIHRYIETLDNPSEKQTYPVAVTFTWQYNGPNGLPAKSEAESMYKLEDLLDERVEKRGDGKLAFVSTGNNLRTWTYYVKSEASFRKALANAAEIARLKVRVSSANDPAWGQLEAFKKSVR